MPPHTTSATAAAPASPLSPPPPPPLPLPSAAEAPALRLRSIIGFSGAVPEGFILHPGRKHRVYPLGSNIIVQEIDAQGVGGRQHFLLGHNNLVTCITCSFSGHMLASGQVTHMGFQADVILWDFETRKPIRRLALHKVRVEALAFSPSGAYLASLGGEDDNSVIVWDVKTGSAICGSPASRDSAGATKCLKFCQPASLPAAETSASSSAHAPASPPDLTFMTGGVGMLRIWELSPETRKIRPTDCQMGQLKRNVLCIAVDKKNSFMYCGTSTGDLLKVSIPFRLFKGSGPPKEKDNFSLGIVTCVISEHEKNGPIFIGAGDGTVAAMDRDTLRILSRTQVEGKVTSIIESPSARTLLVSTAQSNIYAIDRTNFANSARIITWHYASVNDIAFAPASSALFATATDADIRIWGSAKSAQEYQRIRLPNIEAKCIAFRPDGGALVSGWSDGKIRAFGPQSGRLQFEIADAHRRCVTAIAVRSVATASSAVPAASKDNYHVVSGGDDGQVRVWRVTREKQVLEAAMKEHKGTVTCIAMKRDGSECVSASSDGSCIVWDLERFVRNQVLFAPSFFKAVCYSSDEHHILTSGSDRKVAYWESYDGSLVREIEATRESDSINGLDITRDGKYFVVGGSGKTVRAFRYEEGDLARIGVGHSTEIQKIRIAPDQSYIVSVSSDGAVFQWDWSN